MKIKTFTLLVSLFYVQFFSQNIGDFKSVISGNWASAATWQVYTATGWVSATQYPGQTSGDYSVTISDGNTVSVGNYTNGNNSGPSLTVSYNIGGLTVLGQLTLNINMELNNTDSLLIDAGTVLWNQNNVYLKLKQNAEVKIINTGTGSCGNSTGLNGYGFIGGSCSNQTSLEIGSITYTNCAGSGNAVAGTFCDVVEAGGTLNATPIASATNICLPNNSVTLTAPSNSNVTETKTYTWSVVSAPMGFSGFSNNGLSSLTVNNLIAGTYVFKLKISITKSGKTFSAEGTVTINVYQAIVSGTINSLNICSKYNTGNTITLSGYNGTITKWQSSTTSNFSTAVTDIANTTNLLILPNNLNADIYYRAVLSNGACSGYSATAAVKTNTTIYTGTWSNGAPDISKRAVFANNFLMDSDLNTCAIEVNNNAVVTIPANKKLAVEGEIEVLSGNIKVENDAYLVQVRKNVTNLGNITVNRKANLKRLDYNYWGTPVSGQELKAFSPNTVSNRFYTYNEHTDGFDVINPTGNNFIAGKGYAIRAPNNQSATIAEFSGVFTGLPNNGDVTVSVSNNLNGFNLIGNPYPSNMSFTDFYNANSAIINNIAYFWTNINPNPAMQNSNYTTSNVYNNYAIYNGSGGVPATGPTGSSMIPNSDFRVGQGFIIQAKSNGNVVFNNSMRNGNTTANFFNKITGTPAKTNVDRFWLQLTTPLELANKILIAYKKEATDGFDVDYDAPHLIIGADSFYSILNQEKLAIQGRNYPLLENDKIQLGASFYDAGNFTISLEEKEGIFANGQAIYLKDNLTGVVTNLSQSSYTFRAEKGEVNNRFEIYFSNKILATDQVNSKNPIVIYKEDNGFVIKASETITEVKVFDASGRYIKHQKVNAKSTQIQLPENQKGVLVFEVITATNKYTKKALK